MIASRMERIRWLRSRARATRLRTMLAFAEAEIVIPDGPFKGYRFNCDRQPYTRHWLKAVDSGVWKRIVSTGPVQSGKTLLCFLIPTLYHLFEVQENVIVGLPDMDMANDKWQVDFMPVIERTRFRNFLPLKGSGSRGGRVKEAVRFTNGATLRFMSGGGGDKSRAGFTSRVVVITETDGMDQAAETSREADKISQLEARTRAYAKRARLYMECTVTNEQGRTWREYVGGTQSRIVLPCPHCHEFVSPERENLVGWQDAQSLIAARAALFYCPACGEEWSETDRRQANLESLLVHHGQTIKADRSIEGADPETDTLGFRWSAVNNLFCDSADIAAEEWRASRDPDEDNSERAQLQFIWAVPHKPQIWESTPLDAQALAERTNNLAKGILPAGTKLLTMHIDTGKYLCHWAMIAWPELAWCVPDYGVLEVPTKELGFERALMQALRQFRDVILAGWPMGEARKAPDEVWIDARWHEHQETVYAFCRESGPPFCPSMGYGSGQQTHATYTAPKTTGNLVKWIGDGYHITHFPKKGVNVAEVDADRWKSWLHERLSCPRYDTANQQPTRGAITFYQSADRREHFKLTKHITAEKEVEEFVPGKGMVKKWIKLRQANHWLDTLYNAAAAGHYRGIRLVQPQIQIAAPPLEPPAESSRRRPAADRKEGWIRRRGS